MTNDQVNNSFRAFVSGLRKRALARQIRPDVFDRAMLAAQMLPDVLSKQDNQAEYTSPIRDYLEKAVSKNRISNGRKAMRGHLAVLNEIEARYKVEANVVVAIWGLESAYGRYRGSFPVISALATLAFVGKRSPFFESELIAALRIIQAGDADSETLLGSWAGAMGHCQFMPSSYLDFAEDFDGDGRRDLWGKDPTDALASIANYFTKHGWKQGQPWGVEVVLPPGFDYAQTGIEMKQSVADWRTMGVVAAIDGHIGEYGPASVILPAGAQGAAFMVFHNFQVILRYNNAQAYALAVGHLADRIDGGSVFRANWPSDGRVLNREEIRDLQTRLTRAGYNTFGADGLTGPNTFDAIRRYQQVAGLVPDGFPSPKLLETLRGGKV